MNVLLHMTHDMNFLRKHIRNRTRIYYWLTKPGLRIRLDFARIRPSRKKPGPNQTFEKTGSKFYLKKTGSGSDLFGKPDPALIPKPLHLSSVFRIRYQRIGFTVFYKIKEQRIACMITVLCGLAIVVLQNNSSKLDKSTPCIVPLNKNKLALIQRKLSQS